MVVKRRYVALARVSSREQEREGFSLDVQEDALRRYAERNGGEVIQLYRIAETASKREERETFKRLLSYVREHADELDGVLFYKVDRAARNLFDYVELERLESEYGVPCIYVTQPTENTPAGRMQRRVLASMASFYTEQQSLDVKGGMARRVENGLFPGQAPYGYENYREDGRGLIRVHSEQGPKVKRIFELYAFKHHTLDSLRQALADEKISYTKSRRRFPRSKLYDILRDRSYIGEIRYHGQWYPGSHESLVDRSLFDRVQVLLGEKTYNSHRSVYGSGMITCGHCGHPIVVEVKTKQTKSGLREYRYYRCAKYTSKDHPRTRLKERDLDGQVLKLFRQMRVEDQEIREWIVEALRAKAREDQERVAERDKKLERALGSVKQQKDRLLELRLADEIDSETFAAKNTELRDRETKLELQIEAQGRQQSENADLAIKAFELSQHLCEKWDSADIPEKRRYLETVCLNFTLDGVTLCPQIRKPFDILAEGRLVQNGRGARI